MNDDAIGRARKMLGLDPENELALFSLGKALFDHGEHAEARQHLCAALSGRPDWMAAQILKARCEIRLGEKEAARASLERAQSLARQQGHAGPLAQVEDLLRQLGTA
jgi:uncharacterized protein HemY